MELSTYLLILVATTLLSVALAPKVQIQVPEAAKSIDLPQAEEGTAQAVIFGDCWSGDWMVLAHGNYRTEEIRRG